MIIESTMEQQSENEQVRHRPVRRIVTGENTQGKSVFVSDGPTPNHTLDPGSPVAHVVWVSGEAATVGPDPAPAGKVFGFHSKGGSLLRVVDFPPPKPEAILGHLFLDESKTATWVYLTGQRRVRKLPNSCCDTPHPTSAGIVTFDEISTFATRLERYDWKLVGKKEMYIPYNSNRTLVPSKDTDVLGPNHLQPDHVRWELHRVWVVEASLKPGQRHTSAKSRYYVDEDSWWPVLADRWDANAQLWRMPFSIPVAMPDLPESHNAGRWKTCAGAPSQRRQHRSLLRSRWKGREF